jgi:hypothetical protein
MTFSIVLINSPEFISFSPARKIFARTQRKLTQIFNNLSLGKKCQFCRDRSFARIKVAPERSPQDCRTAKRIRSKSNESFLKATDFNFCLTKALATRISSAGFELHAAQTLAPSAADLNAAQFSENISPAFRVN